MASRVVVSVAVAQAAEMAWRVVVSVAVAQAAEMAWRVVGSVAVAQAAEMATRAVGSVAVTGLSSLAKPAKAAGVASQIAFFLLVAAGVVQLLVIFPAVALELRGCFAPGVSGLFWYFGVSPFTRLRDDVCFAEGGGVSFLGGVAFSAVAVKDDVLY